MPKSDDNRAHEPNNKKVIKRSSVQQIVTATTFTEESEEKKETTAQSSAPIAEIKPKVIWEVLGNGSYNRVWRSDINDQLVSGSLYSGPWVLKYPIISSKDPVSNEMNNPERGVRLWNEINKGLPIAGLHRKGWVAPYIQNARQATDDEVALKLIEIYRTTRRIVLDAATSKNCLTIKDTGEVVLVDVDLALRRRNSQVSFHFAQSLGSRFSSYWTSVSLKKSMPQTMNVTQNLLFLEDNLSLEEIDQLDAENLITLQNLTALTSFREQNKVLDICLFRETVSLIQIELEISEMLLEITKPPKPPYYGNNKRGFFSSIPSSSVEDHEKFLQGQGYNKRV